MWTDLDTAAYWAEVAAEERSDAARVRHGRGGIDPLGWRVLSMPVAPEGGREGDGDAEDDPRQGTWTPDYGAVWVRAVSLLPEGSRAVLGAAVAAGRRGAGRPGRSGDGVACAREMGITQSAWVRRLDAATVQLGVVAPWARDDRGAWDADRVVDRAPSRSADLVRAYLNSWSTLAAARAVGVAQSTAYARLRRCGPVIGAIMDCPPLRARRGGHRQTAGPP